ncbi:type VI secretion system-associated FHA domain protein TagH [Rouxiella sp. Mn2063]|uniref:type VI secretion system-associated FHA domain protein TagH n=1 Tax=Rouxiella sp. Mn2063 TaxID=3395262 RepID=UPI003BBCBB3F
MRFTIISTKPGHQPPQSSCDFYQPGGTIGRGTDNNLVLPDNERIISRLQAIVHIAADDECRITNRGNVTRVVLNDIPLERGRQVELQDGDILGIDDYLIEVTDLTPRSQPASRLSAVSQPISKSSASRQAAHAAKDSGPTAVPTEIWDSLMQEFSISDSISSSRQKPQDVQNFNPFTAPKEPERNPEDPLAHFTTSSEPLFEQKRVDTDKLFSEDALFKSDSIFNDVTPSSLVPPVGERARETKKHSADELDPLALFGGSAGGQSQTRGDDPLGLMMGGAVPLTQPDSSTPASKAAPEREQQNRAIPMPPPKAQESSDILSTLGQTSLNDSPLFVGEEFAGEELAGEAFTNESQVNNHIADERFTSEVRTEQQSLQRQAVQQQESQQPQAASDAQDYAGITLPTPQAVQRHAAQVPKGRLRIDPVQSGSGQADAPSKPSSGDVLQGELLEALLEGMGLGDMKPVPQFDRENMRQLGQMLSMFSQGTVALLSSRSILKRGVKADMTMVLDDANNPFKLLPSGKTVLMQMFGTHMPGFMPPKKSVRDALIDLQAHQLGMISGIRAIIASMLQSFNPEQLEEEAKRDGAVSRLSLPASRKAALWDHFVRCYGNTAGEIEDDFHTLFGEAFLHAYDMEVNQYKDSQSGSEEQ